VQDAQPGDPYTRRCSNCQRRTQRADGAVERRGRQRRQQHEAREAHQDERPLGDVLGDLVDLQAHVEPAVAEQVQHHVEVREQPQHAAESQQRRQVGDGSHRRDGQRQAEEAQRPVAQRADQVFLPGLAPSWLVSAA
jgi:hypothetical protein